MLAKFKADVIIFPSYKECVRDKLADRTATCPNGKVLKLERWENGLKNSPVGFVGHIRYVQASDERLIKIDYAEYLKQK